MKPTLRRLTAAALILSVTAAAGPFPKRTAEAADVPHLDNIRVALMLESGKLKSSAATITLSSAKGVGLSLQTADASLPWPAEAAPAGKLRAGPDGYSIRFLETPDYAKAKTLADTLSKSATGPASSVAVTAASVKAQTLYTVAAVGYATKEEASQALAGYARLPAVSALADKPVLGGPFRLQAGLFGSYAEAEQLRAKLAQAGLASAVAVTVQGQAEQFAVWTGAEADADALQAYQARIQPLLAAQSYTSADRSAAYALVLKDATGSADGSTTSPFILYSTQGLKLKASPKEGELTIVEKASRTYRGQAELSVYGGKLALINELPFEQYLYSVVSGEMGKGWPAEALKAQAVAARTYALKSGNKYQVAQVSDTTFDQVYTGNEDDDSIKAVDATKGEVLVNQDGLITALFSANAGGMTSSGADVWGTDQPYLKTEPSPDDGAAKNKAVWKHAVLPDNQIAYIHASYVKATGKSNPAGLPIYQVTESGVNARTAPYVDNTNNPPVAKLNEGDQVVVFGEAQESNAYRWTRGPYSPSELLKLLNDSLPDYKLKPIQAPLTRLEVTGRGASGRVTELAANGSSIKLTSPDSFRTLLGGLPSTRFEIDRTGGYTIQGANGAQGSVSSGVTVYAVSAGGQAQPVQTNGYFVMNGSGQVDYAKAETQYTITGSGSGHGLGLSQWGARGFAELGYDYRYILNYYYVGVTITKE